MCNGLKMKKTDLINNVNLYLSYYFCEGPAHRVQAAEYEFTILLVIHDQKQYKTLVGTAYPKILLKLN